MMDVDKIARYGDPAVVAREVSVALILSELVSQGLCPNFIETHQVFQLTEGPNPWQSGGESSKPSSSSKGNFQYIRMELCEGGDLEEHMKTVPWGRPSH